MAKVKVNKSSAAREYMAAHPQAKNSEIVAALKKGGVSINPSQVSQLRKANGTTRQVAKATGRVGRPKGSIAKPRASKSEGSLSPSEFKNLKAFVEDFGGVEAVEAGLELLSEYEG